MRNLKHSKMNLRKWRRKVAQLGDDGQIWDETQVPNPRNLLHANLSCSYTLLDKDLIVLFCISAYMGQCLYFM